VLGSPIAIVSCTPDAAHCGAVIEGGGGTVDGSSGESPNPTATVSPPDLRELTTATAATAATTKAAKRSNAELLERRKPRERSFILLRVRVFAGNL
jgi:hypothetical protein